MHEFKEQPDLEIQRLHRSRVTEIEKYLQHITSFNRQAQIQEIWDKNPLFVEFFNEQIKQIITVEVYQKSFDLNSLLDLGELKNMFWLRLVNMRKLESKLKLAPLNLSFAEFENSLVSQSTKAVGIFRKKGNLEVLSLIHEDGALPYLTVGQVIYFIHLAAKNYIAMWQKLEYTHFALALPQKFESEIRKQIKLSLEEERMYFLSGSLIHLREFELSLLSLLDQQSLNLSEYGLDSYKLSFYDRQDIVRSFLSEQAVRNIPAKQTPQTMMNPPSGLSVNSTNRNSWKMQVEDMKNFTFYSNLVDAVIFLEFSCACLFTIAVNYLAALPNTEEINSDLHLSTWLSVISFLFTAYRFDKVNQQRRQIALNLTDDLFEKNN